MKNLDYNQIINLESRGEEDKDNIYIYIYLKNFDKTSAIWWNYLAQPRCLSLTCNIKIFSNIEIIDKLIIKGLGENFKL